MEAWQPSKTAFAPRCEAGRENMVCKRIREKRKTNESISRLIESDYYFGFIAGYTSNGVPFGLTHEEFDKILMEETTDDNLPF